MPSNPAKLHLAVQYATDCEDWLPRWRVRSWVLNALNAIEAPPATLTIRFVDAKEGRELNRGFRGAAKDYATNVLTFALEQSADAIEADIVICPQVLRREAREQRKELLHHAAHLTIHGVLHAAGYDHIKPRDAKQMEALEIAILQRMRITNPYE